MAHRQSLWVSHMILCMMAVLSACAGPESVTIPPYNRSTFFAKLVVHEPAVTLVLSPGANTMQLHVTAEFADGSPVSSHPVFETMDSTILVDSTGIITAVFPTTDLAVVRISVTEARHTRRDSVLIRVLAVAPTVEMTRLSVSVPPGTSPTLPVFTAPTAWAFSQPGQLQLAVTAMNDAGDAVPSEQIVIAIRCSDSSIAKVTQTGFITAVRPGRVVITAITMANGRIAMDSLSLHIGLPLFVEVPVLGPYSATPSIWRMAGETVQIGVNGVVQFTNDAAEKVDLIFDDTTHLISVERPIWGESGTGNVRGLGYGTLDCRPGIGVDLFECLRVNTQARRFTAPGRYRFTGTVTGSSVRSALRGVVVVCAEGAVVCEP